MFGGGGGEEGGGEGEESRLEILGVFGTVSTTWVFAWCSGRGGRSVDDGADCAVAMTRVKSVL